MLTVGPGVCRETETHGKIETHTVGRKIWQESLKNVKNEKYTLQDLDYGEKTEKTWKMRHKHCGTCNIVRNTEKRGK